METKSRKLSAEHRRKLSEAKKGRPSPMQGERHSQKTKQKNISNIKRGDLLQ